MCVCVCVYHYSVIFSLREDWLRCHEIDTSPERPYILRISLLRPSLPWSNVPSRSVHLRSGTISEAEVVPEVVPERHASMIISRTL